ncbi:MAG: hypothetical protein KDK36_17545 [Leptospiraceae bacterium]|nr:hypothetical protein [Leptospiraceae bacterium]
MSVEAQDALKIEINEFIGGEFIKISETSLEGNSLKFGLTENDKHIIAEEYNSNGELISNAEYEVIEVSNNELGVVFSTLIEIQGKPTKVDIVFFKEKNLIEFVINKKYYFYSGNVDY